MIKQIKIERVGDAETTTIVFGAAESGTTDCVVQQDSENAVKLLLRAHNVLERLQEIRHNEATVGEVDDAYVMAEKVETQLFDYIQQLPQNRSAD